MTDSVHHSGTEKRCNRSLNIEVVELHRKCSASTHGTRILHRCNWLHTGIDRCHWACCCYEYKRRRSDKDSVYKRWSSDHNWCHQRMMHIGKGKSWTTVNRYRHSDRGHSNRYWHHFHNSFLANDRIVSMRSAERSAYHSFRWDKNKNSHISIQRSSKKWHKFLDCKDWTNNCWLGTHRLNSYFPVIVPPATYWRHIECPQSHSCKGTDSRHWLSRYNFRWHMDSIGRHPHREQRRIEVQQNQWDSYNSVCYTRNLCTSRNTGHCSDNNSNKDCLNGYIRGETVTSVS